ncbi:MAG: hypothetical protein PHD82_00635 [Candidatus Riflebacteria bacterium]|jgi:hypothetical protein|nr:hypothetical protein [Candidatus Riflebacteria bacterium]
MKKIKRVFTGCMFLFTGTFLLLNAGESIAQPAMNGGAGMRQAGGGMQMGALRTAQQQKLQDFLAAEEAEGKEFMESMAGKPKSELITALKDFKTRQYEKNTAFRQQLQEERLATLEAGFAARPGANPAMKEHALSRFSENYEEIKAFFAGKHQENMDFLDRVNSDATLDGQALNSELQRFFQGQKESAKAYMDQKKSQGMQKR